jgi:hypothetical protein
MLTNNAQLQRNSFGSSDLKFDKKSSISGSVGDVSAKKGANLFTDQLKMIKTKVEAPSASGEMSGAVLPKVDRCGVPDRSLLNLSSNPRLFSPQRCGLPDRSLSNLGSGSLVLTADRCPQPQRVVAKG